MPGGRIHPLRTAFTLATIAWALASGSQVLGAPPTPIDFSRQIRPILSANCFECHGPDAHARKAGLRLDLEEGRATIEPGDPNRSLLFQRVTASDPDDRMPPPDSRHAALEDEHIELIRRWINEGGHWANHWAYIPPSSSEAPSVKDASWCRDPIDSFILADLQKTGLSPAPEADREILLRRLAFDLTGLPPTIEDMDAFLTDSQPGAYRRVIEKLLASPAFGERMASDWLDLARYADTYGYQSDVDRSVWPYRDWVIKAFNDGLPHDEFIIWQLAGDLLPNATQEQRLATAFNRLHRQTNEGGSVEEEFRVEYVADRVHTFGTAVLGVTTECARCHDHKFDPISQREYYQLAAFFDNIDESGLYSHFTNAVPSPSLLLSSDESAQQIQTLRARIEAEAMALQNLRNERREPFQTWLESSQPGLPIAGMRGNYPLESTTDGKLTNRADETQPGGILEEPEIIEGVLGNGLRMSGEDNLHFPGVGEFTRNDPFTIALWMKVPMLLDRAVVIHRSRAWTDAGSQGYQLLLKNGRPSWSLIHFWPGNAISIETEESLPIEEWTHLAVSYDGSARASGLAIYINGEGAPAMIVRDNLFKPITGGSPGHLTLGQRFRDRGFKGGSVDEIKVFGRELLPIEIDEIFTGTALESARLEHTEALYDYYLANHDPPFQLQLEKLRAARVAHAGAIDQISEIMTMEEMDEPRSTHVLERGHYEARGERVEPSTPRSIMPYPETLPANRLGLARWATSPQNPLTARVAVNRYWMLLFGRGLVATPEDFGSQGMLPTHPELLDTLALDFVASGWNVKSMLKRMVNSATYRQSSRVSPAEREEDPANTRLARGPGYRLTAEMIRDQALAASGLLANRIGGPSVYPYQPAGLWQEKSGKVYPQGKGESLHRRSLYTFWKRTSPPPSMMILDSAKRDVCVARRALTTTPLQALLLLNDPQYSEASRVLAERSLKYGGDTTRERITFAFRLLSSRQPTSEELDVLLDLHEDELQLFLQEESSAQSVASSGSAPRAEDLNSAEVAALALVCSTILNSDAAVMRR